MSWSPILGKLLSMDTATDQVGYDALAAHYQAIGDPDHFRHIFDQVANVLRLTDSELATRANTSRNTINAKRKGTSRISPRDFWPLATALGLPLSLWFQESVPDAIRFALDHKTFDPDSNQFSWIVRV